eukprot:gene15828-18654_t
MDALGHFNIPQLGRVIIGNDVQIGSNTTIDRGSLTDTKIGNGVRIDNLVQIAHNVEVGDNSVLVAQAGIAGSTKLGRFVIVAGQVGISGHLTVGDGVKIAAQSGIMRDVEKGEIIAGSPAIPVLVTTNIITHNFEANSHEGLEIEIEEIMQLIPHRYPFLLIDRIVDVKPGHSAVGIKNVSINEWYFQGHFPSHPILPGVLIIEAMAQTAGALVIKSLLMQKGAGSVATPSEDKLVYFMSVEEAKFRKP